MRRISVCRKCKSEIANFGQRGPVRAICASCRAIEIKAEREKHRKPRKVPLWTPAEDKLVLKLSPRDAVEITGRSYGAVIQRRGHLRHPEWFAKCKQRVGWNGWSEADLRLLREKYITVKRIPELIDVFGGRLSLPQILSKARRLGLRRKHLGSARLSGHNELVDQIRIRAREDGIPIYKLDKICGTKSYFAYNAHRRRVNLRAVAKALEFFGAKLVIEWCDR